MLHPATPPYMTFLSEGGHHYIRDNEESKMKRMKEEEMEIREGWGVKEEIGGGIRRGNCSGMEAMTVIITFQTNYHRASGNELLMLYL